MRQLRSPILFLPLLAFPLFAQEEELHGTWDSTVLDDQIGEIFTSLTFEEDGAFEISQVIQVREDFLAGFEIPGTDRYRLDHRPAAPEPTELRGTASGST